MIDALSNEDRIEHYRELALEAMEHAQKSAVDAHRAAFLTIAAHWAALADDVERRLRQEAKRGLRLAS